MNNTEDRQQQHHRCETVVEQVYDERHPGVLGSLKHKGDGAAKEEVDYFTFAATETSDAVVIIEDIDPSLGGQDGARRP